MGNAVVCIWMVAKDLEEALPSCRCCSGTAREPWKFWSGQGEPNADVKYSPRSLRLNTFDCPGHYPSDLHRSLPLQGRKCPEKHRHSPLYQIHCSKQVTRRHSSRDRYASRDRNNGGARRLPS